MSTDSLTQSNPWDLYEVAVAVAVAGDVQAAQERLVQLRTIASESRLLAHVENDLGVLAAQTGDTETALGCFSLALGHWPGWTVAQENLDCLQPRRPSVDVSAPPPKRTRVAIVSLLFNWPSTGGGTVHTAEAAQFLSRAGYDVQHLSVRYDPWGLGQIRVPTDWPLQELVFNEPQWNRIEIERRLRAAVDDFRPDAIIVTDSWSMKPRLAEALSGYRVYLRLAAQECLCPLN